MFLVKVDAAIVDVQAHQSSPKTVLCRHMPKVQSSTKIRD